MDAPLRLGTLRNPVTVARYLMAGGVRAAAATRLAERYVEAATVLLGERGEDETAYAFFVPGRIEVLGKHTDYAGGSTLLCAVERGFCLIATEGAGADFHVTDATTGGTVRCPLRADATPEGEPWATYVATVARRVVRNFPGPLRGGRIAFASDLPQAAGMSSSSALIIALFLALDALNNLAAHPAYREHIGSPADLAQYLGTVENGRTFGTLEGDTGVGTIGGSGDHTAILCAEPRHLRRYAYAPVRLMATVPVPEGYSFAIAASGVVAQKTGAAQAGYNRVSREATAITHAWQKATGRADPHLAAILAAPGFTSARMHTLLDSADEPPFTPEALRDRFDQFYQEEHHIIPAAVEALRVEDLGAFGTLVARSQEAAERLLKNQVEETAFLARAARACGAVAASAFGGGFGGSVWAMIPQAHADAFLDAWATRYTSAFPEPAQRARFFLATPGPAAFRL